MDSSPVVKNQAIQRRQNFQKLAQFTVWFLEAVCSVDVHAVKDFLHPSWVTICSSFWQFPKHGLIIVLLICHTNYNKKMNCFNLWFTKMFLCIINGSYFQKVFNLESYMINRWINQRMLHGDRLFLRCNTGPISASYELAKWPQW